MSSIYSATGSPFSKVTDPFFDDPEIPDSPQGKGEKEELIEWDCSMESPPRNVQENSFRTPQKKRKIDLPDEQNSTQITPQKIKAAFRLIDEEGAFLISPNAKGKKIIAEGLELAKTLPTSTRKRKAHDLEEKIYTQLAPDCDPNSVEFHYKADETLRTEGLSDTGKKISRTRSQMLGESPKKRVLPMRHLTKLDEKNRGYHLRLEDDLTPIKEIARNPATGIRFVSVDGKKLSTLFPEGTDEKKLIEITDTAKKIIENENRSLRITSDKYIIECYSDTNAARIAYSSVFPLLFFAEFSPSQEFQITSDFSLSSDQMLKDAMSDNGKKKSPEDLIRYTRYDMNGELDQVFVDLAPIYQEHTGVDRGIMVYFDRENATDLFEFYRLKMPELFYQETDLDKSF